MPDRNDLIDEQGTPSLYWNHARVKGLVEKMRSKYPAGSEDSAEVCALLALSRELWSALELINELSLDDEHVLAVAERLEKKISTGKTTWERAEEYLVRHSYDERVAG